MKFITNKKTIHTGYIRMKSFSTKKITYTRKELDSKSVQDLRQLARTDRIRLSGATRKNEIVNVMLAYYLQVRSSKSETTLPKTFTILTDDNNNINVSIWFQGNSKTLERRLSSKRFTDLLDQYCEENQKQSMKF